MRISRNINKINKLLRVLCDYILHYLNNSQEILC